MDDKDKNDIIKKVENSGANDNQDNGNEQPDNQGDMNNDTPESSDNQQDNEQPDLNEGNFLLQNPKKLSIFAPKGSKEYMDTLKETIKTKLKENFNDVNEELLTGDETKTAEPEIKPKTVEPNKVEPLRKNKPFLPIVKPSVQPDPKAEK